MTLFERGDYLFSFDLNADWYHHINIAEKHCKDLGFSWQKRCSQFSPSVCPLLAIFLQR